MIDRDPYVRSRRLRDIVRLQWAAELVLRFHSGAEWSDHDRELWKRRTGRDEATTKVMCDFLRSALAATGRRGFAAHAHVPEPMVTCRACNRELRKRDCEEGLGGVLICPYCGTNRGLT